MCGLQIVVIQIVTYCCYCNSYTKNCEETTERQFLHNIFIFILYRDINRSHEGSVKGT